METLIAILALWTAPAHIMWSLLSSARLNRDGSATALRAETSAWIGFATAALGVAIWVAFGRAALTWGIGSQAVFGLRLDSLTAPLLLLVTFLGAVILRFSRNYLSGDKRQGHFIKWICVTLGSVTALILSPGLVQFALAWVATSLSLHQLLVFFPNRHGTLFSARKKFLFSRAADLCILAAFTGLYSTFGTQNFEQLFTQLSGSEHALGWMAWLIAVAAILKSAQFPFHTWLPDTMGTPTPVSALMHAGIINAGGILVIRFSSLFSQETAPLYALAIIGAITAVFASLVMLSQTSIKRSLAYSTIAQMGFMLMQCGLGAYHIALLHILAHSLYKAHSFLSTGSTVQVIDSHSSESTANTNSHMPLLAAFGLSFLIVFGLSLASGANPDTKPGMLVLSVVVAMAMSQLFLRQLRRDASGAAVLKVTAMATAITIAYLGLVKGADLWMAPLLTETPQVLPAFEWILAFALFLALATTLQLQIGSRFLIPLRLRDALYVHALNGFYANIIANRILSLIKLQPKQS